MQEEHKLLATYAKPLDAQLASVVLETAGIDALVLDETGWHSYRARNSTKLYVSENDYEKAAAILQEYENAKRKDATEISGICLLCPLCGADNIGPDRWRKWFILLTILTFGACFSLLFLCKRYSCRECKYRW